MHFRLFFASLALRSIMTIYKGKHNVDILSLALDFDVASFAMGAASTGALTGGVAWVRNVRKNRSSKGIDAARQTYLSSMKPQYANVESLFSVLESYADEVSHEYTFAYPKITVASITQVQERVKKLRETLNAGLIYVNEIENTHLDRKTLDKKADDFRKLFALVPDDIQSVRYTLNSLQGDLKRSQAAFRKLTNTKLDLESRLAALKETYAEAETRFDKVYLEKIPPAIFQAEKQYNSVAEILSKGFYAPLNQSHRNGVLDRASTAMKRAENHMQTALNFSDIARRKTAKMRVALRNSLAPRDAEETVMCEAAVVSLMDAEAFSYTEGNPAETFDAMIAPYNEYVHARRTIKKKR